MKWLEEHNKLLESQTGFRFGLSCVDNFSVVNEVDYKKVGKHFRLSLI